MAVGAKGLQIAYIVILFIAVFVVYIQLAFILSYKTTRFTVVFLVYSVRITKSIIGCSVRRSTTPFRVKFNLTGISQLNLYGSADRTSTSTSNLVYFGKAMLHQPDRVR